MIRAGLLLLPALALLGVARVDQPAQPIAFSHQIHAGLYKLPCFYCHSGARRSTVAGIPSVQLCMGCHRMAAVAKPEIVRLRGYFDRGTPIPWTRVVQEPDFVFFNHSPHIQRGLRCQECHGPVETMTQVRLVRPLDMDRCVACHRQKAASTDCYVCHR
jgi:hypothetical protein